MRIALFAEFCIAAFTFFAALVEAYIAQDAREGAAFGAFVFVALNIAAVLFLAATLVWRWAA